MIQESTIGKIDFIGEVEEYAIFVLNKNGHIVSWNNGAEKQSGYAANEVLTKHFRMFYTADNQNDKLPESILEQACNKGKSIDEGWRIGKGQKKFWDSEVITAIHDDKGNIIGFVKISPVKDCKKEDVPALSPLTQDSLHYPNTFNGMGSNDSGFAHNVERGNIAATENRQGLDQPAHNQTRELQLANQALCESNEQLVFATRDLQISNKKLADATRLIQIQSAIIDLQKDERRSGALESGNDCAWSPDLTEQDNDYMTRSAQTAIGIPVDTFLLKKASWLEMGYAPDLEIFKADGRPGKCGHPEQTCRLVETQGGIHWMEANYSIVRDKNTISLSTDVTQMRKAQKALTNERKLLRSLIDNIPDYIYIKDLELKNVLNNKASVQLLGASMESETLGKTAIDYFGAEAENYLEDDRRVIATGESIINKEETLITPDNEKLILLTTKIALRDNSNNITGLIGISRDITTRRKQEQALLQYQENLDILFRSTKEEILLLDHEGKVVLFNNAFERFLLKNPHIKPIIGQYLWDLPIVDRNDITLDKFNRAIGGEVVYSVATIPIAGVEVVHELRYEPILIHGIVKYVSLISTDITGRKEHEKELKQNKYLLGKAYEIAQIGYWSYDSDINRSEWNEQSTWIFGLSRNSQGTLEEYLAIVHPDDRLRVEKAAFSTIHEKKSYNIEHRIIRPSDGNVRWVHKRADFISGENNSGLLIGIVQDITERKKIEETFLEYNERYEILSKATNDAIWDWDIENDLEIWNHGIQTIFGYTENQVGSTKSWWRGKIHRDDYDRVLHEIDNAFTQQKIKWTSQYCFLCADGSYKNVLDRAYIIYREGRPVRVIGAMQDITEQKQYEISITTMARELSDLIENANTPIFGTDCSGYVNEWNKVTAELTGHSKSEAMGKELAQYVHESERANFNLILHQVTSDNPISNLQIPMIAKDNHELIILLNATPRKNSLQQMIGVLMVGQNITELIEYRQNLEAKVHERTRELNEALHKEKDLVELKSKFISIASHEFRTPLSTISLVSGFLKKHSDKITPSEFNKKLETVEKQVSHMTYLLDDILVIGKSDAGKIKTQYTTIDIQHFFRETAREVKESTKTHTIDLLIKCSVKEFRTDEKLIRNIVINLLTNAIKFSPHAHSISLRVSNSLTHLKIETEDTGIGITEEDNGNLFTAFHRGSNVGTIQGTGLGLSIVKKAVDLLHGDIQIVSKAAQGTLITVNLPLSE